MAANYAGLKFYLNLTRPVMLGGRRLPAILVKRLGLWEINRELPTDFFKPFISEHLNEAMNPSLYSPLLQNTVRTNFASRAVAWAAFYHADHQSEQARLHRLTTFFGEYYGHSEMEGVIAAADLIPDRKIVAHQSAGNADKVSAVAHE